MRLFKCAVIHDKCRRNNGLNEPVKTGSWRQMSGESAEASPRCRPRLTAGKAGS